MAVAAEWNWLTSRCLLGVLFTPLGSREPLGLVLVFPDLFPFLLLATLSTVDGAPDIIRHLSGDTMAAGDDRLDDPGRCNRGVTIDTVSNKPSEDGLAEG